MLIAAARGGNIIGGGDWSKDRLIPDFARAVQEGRSINLRNPAATRPWQHVLCLIHGYLIILARMLEQQAFVSDAWNLGPRAGEAMSVGQVVERLRQRWSDLDVKIEPSNLHETAYLGLDSTKAERLLGWRPAWSMAEALDKTADWYSNYQEAPGRSSTITRAQIEEYRASLSV
jgi:CDP-glucose 4,6-dehydratase